MSIGASNAAKNKRMISNFLYNKSQFIRNLIMTNKCLAEAIATYSYNIDDFEQVLRFYYVMVKAQQQAKQYQMYKIQQGVVQIDNVNENDFGQFITKFVSSECSIESKCFINHFKQIRKINKNIFNIVVKILEINFE